MVSVTLFFAAIFGLIVVALSVNVVNHRVELKVPLGDGGKDEMLRAMRIHANLLEYVPIMLIIMAGLELSGFSEWVIFALGVMLVVARLLHMSGMSQKKGPSTGRVLGTMMTFLILMISSVLCIFGAFGVIF